MRIRGREQLSVVAASLLFAGACGVTEADSAPATSSVAPHDGQHDFDFLLGSWKIHLKKRLHPLSAANEWVEFDGTVVCRTIWNGLAEVEEFNVDSPEKNIFIQGLAVRLYNPKTRQWSIYWANRKNGVFDAAPQVGQFTDGRGEFSTRVCSVIQVTSQLLPPSSENACSKWGAEDVVLDQAKRT